MLATVTPVCHKVPLVLAKTSDDAEHIVIPGRFVQYLHPFQREGIRHIHSQYLNGIGVVLNDGAGFGKTVQTVLYISALHQQPITLPSLIICSKQRINHWKFHFYLWSDKKPDVAITTDQDVNDIIKHKWGLVVFDTLNPAKIIFILKNLKFQFKMWITDEDLLENLSLLHAIGTSVGAINGNVSRDAFVQKFSHSDKLPAEANRSLQLLDSFCERWLIRRRKDKPNFLPSSVYNKYLQEWAAVYDVQLENDNIEHVTSSFANNTDNVVNKRCSKDITGLKIKRSKKTQQEICHHHANGASTTTVVNNDEPSKDEVNKKPHKVNETEANLIQNILSLPSPNNDVFDNQHKSKDDNNLDINIKKCDNHNIINSGTGEALLVASKPTEMKKNNSYDTKQPHYLKTLFENDNPNKSTNVSSPKHTFLDFLFD